MARRLLCAGAMRGSLVASVLLPVALSLGACGGVFVGDDGEYYPPGDAGADACPPGAYPVECPGVFLYCCPPGAHCAPPSCGSPDAGDAPPPEDAGACPPDQYLVVPCCGGFDDTSCSNGPGPPTPFCSALPSSCDGSSACTLGGCDGPIDESARTLECTCI